jgi:hypothetical protein
MPCAMLTGLDGEPLLADPHHLPLSLRSAGAAHRT